MDTRNFYETVNLNLRDGDIIVPDGGGSFFEPMQFFWGKRDMRFVVSALGTMGWSLPAAIGAYFADPTRRVICIIGDGSMQLNIQELATVMHHQIPLKIFYIDNGGYQTIHNTQKKFFGRYIGESSESGISFPDIGKIAGAYGIFITEAIQTAMEIDIPVICEVNIERGA